MRRSTNMSDARIYQYPLLHDLDLMVDSFIDAEQSVELENVVLPAADFGGKRYDFIEASPRWNVLKFRATVRVNEADLSAVLPEGDSLDAVSPKILVSCSATKYRIGYPLQRGEDDETWIAEIQLARADL